MSFIFLFSYFFLIFYYIMIFSFDKDTFLWILLSLFILCVHIYICRLSLLHARCHPQGYIFLLLSFHLKKHKYCFVIQEIRGCECELHIMGEITFMSMYNYIKFLRDFRFCPPLISILKMEINPWNENWLYLYSLCIIASITGWTEIQYIRD